MMEHAPHRMQRETPHKRFLRWSIDALVVVLIALNWIATQVIARALNYPAFFMGRMFGHVYQPFAWWWWWHYWPHNDVRVGHQIISLERAWTLCNHIVFYPTLALIVVGGMAVGLAGKWGGSTDLHGTAAWAKGSDVRSTNLW